MGPLSGIKVLDLSRVLAGPLCTLILADLGAEVVKVEPPWGDETRGWGPPFLQGESAYFLSVNRGKRSVALDLKHPEGQEAVRRLAREADVLVENFKTGDLARYGLDYAGLSAINPRLVYLSLTGFGHTGPRAKEPGYDAALQGYTGIMSVTGEPQGPPMKVGVAWIDVMTGMMGAIAVLAALWERERSGLGQHIDLSLFDVGLFALANLGQSYLLTGKPPKRLGNAHAQIVPYGAFPAEDGWLVLAVGNDEQFARLCQVLGLPELRERFPTNRERVTHREEVVEALAQVLRTKPRAHWLKLFQAVGVPAAPVNDLAEAFQDPQAQARGAVWSLEHPLLGTLPTLANPLRFLSRTPASPPSPPPLLGEHTEAVLLEAGFTPEEVRRLVEKGIARVAKRPEG
ncbi:MULTISPECIES: CaiB/BaiF CoA transferase family protein [Thermus]|jgi:crotonobetainyl-CoA:carnitine CoA-transferase CaiB-like acyl-CoA transferase|uniref:CAIB/BAIF family protein n=1 Tax=Thermus brockianus TaxID=56956 RepID=A0A1J0LRP9_THEBO|nr:CoA transferase [Thermus brockianus]APD09009.1 CAIB/BAIF family protein [Thermus brockianus]BDG15558.1 CoA transferase [Thermus brockianus]